MGNRSNDYSAAVTDELTAAGVKFEDAHCAKHRLITWTGANGRRRVFTAKTTPGDRRALQNARCDVRRMLREDGNINGAKK
jgi:hypothetical protein